ncbi:type II toxin-antitoxin system Phd/YefM family antitoxin [Aquipseudomonas campi]
MQQETSSHTNTTANEARTNVHRLMDQSAGSHQPILISSKRTNYVLVSAEDWEAIQETLGHTDTTLVKKHYGRWTPSDTKSLAGRVSKMMGFRQE